MKFFTMLVSNMEVREKSQERPYNLLGLMAKQLWHQIRSAYGFKGLTCATMLTLKV